MSKSHLIRVLYPLEESCFCGGQRLYVEVEHPYTKSIITGEDGKQKLVKNNTPKKEFTTLCTSCHTYGTYGASCF